MSAARPLARDDLDIASREIDDETVYFLGDPIKNEYKQLDELQYEVFRRLDGHRTIEEIAQELYDTYEVEVSVEDLSEFISGLADMNLLDPSTDPRQRPSEPEVGQRILRRMESEGVVFGRRGSGTLHQPPGDDERRRRPDEAALFDAALDRVERGQLQQAAAFLRSVLEINRANHRARYLLHAVLSAHVGKKQDFESMWFWRVPLVNPDRLLERIHAVVGRFIYTRAFLITWLVCFVVCTTVLLFDIDRVIADIRYLFSFRWLFSSASAIPVLWVVGAFSLLLHEGAHGLTCKHFGGRVREMGLLVAYLSPTAYCDVSSSYLMQNKWHRILISFAGAMSQMCFWFLAVALYYLFRTDTTIGVIAFVIVMNGPSYLANLDPSVRSDGYLALTDLLDYPNLRDDAFTYLRLRADKLLLGSDVQIPPDLEARRKLFLWYAIPGFVFTVIVATGGLWLITSILIEQLHTLGVILASVLVWLAAGRFLLLGARAVWKQRRRLWSSPRARRAITAVVLAPIAALAMPYPLLVDALCLTRPDIVSIRAPEASPIAEILVEPGQQVTKGQVLARLGSEVYEVALARSTAELESAKLDLQKLRQRARDEELGVARARLEGQRAILAANQRRLARLRRLASAQLVSSRELDQLIADREQARTEVRAASEELEVLSAEAMDAEVAAAEALIRMLEAQVEEDRRRLDATVLKSPVAGRVELPAGVTKDDLVGRLVGVGDEVMRVRRLGGEVLELHVPITEPLALASKGAPVEARLRGMPHDALTGTLAKIGTTFEVEDLERGMTRSWIRADVQLANEVATLGLPAGLSGKAQIEVGSYPIAYHAYVRLVRLIEVDANRLLNQLGD